VNRGQREGRQQSPEPGGGPAQAQSTAPPAPRRRGRRLLAAGSLLALLVLGGLGWRLWGAGPSGTLAGANILLITLDTTRADRLGCYGYQSASTPTLDRLARGGTCFDSAFAQVPLTLPSHASLLTGTYPAELGILDNGQAALPGDIRTLAEICWAHGYQTAAFVAASVLDHRFGLDAGFDTYDDQLPASPSGLIEYDQERPADVVCGRALAWLESASGPSLCWVHFFDPHAPYQPPEPFRSRLADPYDGEVAFADAQVGRLVSWLEAHGLVDRTLVVVAGDHGEGLGEHGESAHGVLLYDSTIRVPLIVSMPTRVAAGRRVAAVVSLVDVLPTLVELLGWPVPDAISGRSFAAALAGDDLPARSSYARSDYALDHFGWARLESVTIDGWKYIDAPQAELYQRGEDPGELRNRVNEQPKVAAALRAELDLFRREMKARPGRRVTMPDAQLEALRSLGYLAGGSAQRQAPPPEARKDPKGMMQVAEDHFRASELAAQGRFGEAVALLEPAAKRSPESYAIRYLLGLLLLEQGNLSGAEVELTAAEAIDPGSSEVENAVGTLRQAQGRVPEAIEHYRRALELSPDSVKARNNLGVALEMTGEIDAALDQYAQAQRLDPDDAKVHNNLGKALLTLGRMESAIAHFRQAIRIDPRFAKAHNNLGAALARQNRFDEAIAHYQWAIRLDPSYSEARNNLGVALMSRGRWAEAVVQYEQALRVDSANPAAHYNLGLALPHVGRPDEAIEHLFEAARLAPAQADVHDQLARALEERGRFREAVAVLEEAVTLLPEHAELALRLAWLLATCPDATVRDGEEAVRLAEPLCREPPHPSAAHLDTLAAAYARAGRFEEAAHTARLAVELAASQGQTELAEAIRARLTLYEAGQPFRSDGVPAREAVP
jgi:arylsulfatase A-like enzyme/Flp pilus assembly protein TadD